MRPFAVVASVAVTAMAALACEKSFVETRASIPVSISITCTGDSLQATIAPYSAKVEFPDIVEWSLVNSPDVSEFSIDKKKGKGWPYGGKLPYKAKKGEHAKGDGINPDAKGKYEYSISATCTPPGDSARSIVIDPDMIIIRRASAQ